MVTVNRVRIEVSKDGVGMFEISKNAQGNVAWGNHRMFYTYDEVPEWIREGIAMLDLATNIDSEKYTPSILVAGVGHKLLHTNIYYLDYKGHE